MKYRFASGCALLMEDIALENRSRTVSVVFLVLSTLILAGCPGRTSIEKINRDPGRYVSREVTIAGHVTNSFGALGSGVYQVDDGTGQMWVFSQNFGVPSNGAKIAVTGNSRTGLQFWWQKLCDHPPANEASILNRKKIPDSHQWPSGTMDPQRCRTRRYREKRHVKDV